MVNLVDVIPWFHAEAFQAGFLVCLWWWVLGLFLGWLFDMIRKS